MEQGKPYPLVWFLAEASSHIGTGHAVETAVLTQEAQARGFGVAAWVNEATPEGLLKRFRCDVQKLDDFEEKNLKSVASRMQAQGGGVVVTNLRCVTRGQVEVLRRYGLHVICIDEWGKRHLNSDVVINATPVTEYHHYESDNPSFQVYLGPSYLALGPEYQTYCQRGRQHVGPIRRVIVAMGGVDDGGVTVQLAEHIIAVRPELDLELVVGAGFRWQTELEAVRCAFPGTKITIHHDLPTLAGLLSTCDVGFTVGGNTLLEMACVGTPALTYFEALHEQEQSLAIERLGFGQCLGACLELEGKTIHDVMLWLDQSEERTCQAAIGQVLVDGKGTSRVLDIVEGLLQRGDSRPDSRSSSSKI